MTAGGSYELLQVERAANGVVTVRLDDPDLGNVLSPPMTASWDRLMAELCTDRSVGAVVVSGAGAAFCIGGDPCAWGSMRDLTVPVLAAINGAAIGAGLSLALAACAGIPDRQRRAEVDRPRVGARRL